MSKKLFLTKTQSGLMPANAETEEIIRKWKVGKSYSFTYKKARNVDHHDLIFGLLGLATRHSNENSVWNGKDERLLLEAIQLTFDVAVGFGMDMNGEVHKKALSVAFENMDENEFEPVSNIVFKEVARIIDIDETLLRHNYKQILEDAKVYVHEKLA